MQLLAKEQEERIQKVIDESSPDADVKILTAHRTKKPKTIPTFVYPQAGAKKKPKTEYPTIVYKVSDYTPASPPSSDCIQVSEPEPEAVTTKVRSFAYYIKRIKDAVFGKSTSN